MNLQFSLEGFESALPAARPQHRLFFALLPDAALAARITQLAQALSAIHGLRGTLIKPEHLHITLHHLGDYAAVPAPVLQMARSTGAAFTAPAIEFSFNSVMSFQRRDQKKPFVLTTEPCPPQLLSLHRALGAAMGMNGLKPLIDRNFKPHCTLAYDSAAIEAHEVEPVQWQARELVLVHSYLGQTRHEHLARWALAK